MGVYAERLIKVREAIDAILDSGQSFDTQGRAIRFAELTQLRQMEKEYESAANREAATEQARSRITYVVPQ